MFPEMKKINEPKIDLSQFFFSVSLVFFSLLPPCRFTNLIQFQIIFNTFRFSRQDLNYLCSFNLIFFLKGVRINYFVLLDLKPYWCCYCTRCWCLNESRIYERNSPYASRSVKATPATREKKWNETRSKNIEKHRF